MQDRLLSTNLGQPNLIPEHHVRMEITGMLAVTQNRSVESANFKGLLSSFRNLMWVLHASREVCDEAQVSNALQITS